MPAGVPPQAGTMSCSKKVGLLRGVCRLTRLIRTVHWLKGGIVGLSFLLLRESAPSPSHIQCSWWRPAKTAREWEAAHHLFRGDFLVCPPSAPPSSLPAITTRKTASCSAVAPPPETSQSSVINMTWNGHVYLLCPESHIFDNLSNKLDKLHHHVLCPWPLEAFDRNGILWNIVSGRRQNLTYWYQFFIIETNISLLLCK